MTSKWVGLVVDYNLCFILSCLKMQNEGTFSTFYNLINKHKIFGVYISVYRSQTRIKPACRPDPSFLIINLYYLHSIVFVIAVSPIKMV